MKGDTMGRTRVLLEDPLLDAVAADGWSSEIDVAEWDTIQLVFSTTGSFQGTLKVATSMLHRDDVAFASAATVDNEWDYVALYNYNDPSSILAGDTGLVYAGTDAVEQLIVNVEGAETLAVNLSGWAAGAVTCKVWLCRK